MQLFDSEMINISRIYTVERYEPEDGKQRITEYDTFFRTYEIVFYLYGETETLVDDVKIYDVKNAIRYMPNGQTCGRYIVERIVPSACIDIYFDTDSPMPEHAFGLRDQESLRDKFLKLYDIWQKRCPGYYADAMKTFYDIIASVQKSQQNYLSGRQKNYMDTAYAYIAEHYKQPNFNYKELCRIVGLEYAYFSELFKKTFHMPPVRFVTKMRIDYAKELLVTNRRSISEIAEMCGFANTYYFSGVFKRETGFAPSKYPVDSI